MKKKLEKSVNNFLKSYFVYTPFVLREEDKRKIERNKVDFILGKFSRKKFRKRKLADKTKEAIKEKIEISVKENRPVHLVIPFGGYKHFWNPSHPEPDWAEMFNFKFLTDYVSPVLAVHKPGAIVEYVSEDLIITRMNNYPKEATERYYKVFLQIIEQYNKFLPDNLKFKIIRVADRCNKEALIRKVESLLPERRKAFEKLSEEEKKRELHRSGRSLMWKGNMDLSDLNEAKRHERLIESRLIELAYYDTEAEKEFLGEYLWEDNHICVCFSFGTTHDNDEFQDLTLGSTYTSVVDHWIGRGVLELRGESFIPRIVSKKQYEGMKDKIIRIGVIDFLPIKNYKDIDVFKGVD